MPGEDPLLLQTEKGSTLTWRGLRFYPSEDPIEYARRKARVFSPGHRSLVLVPSVGLGHGLAELLQALPADCSILCVEVFQEVMGLAIAQGLPRDPRLRIIRTDDCDAVAATLREMGVGRFKRVAVMPLCAGYRLAAELYESFRVRLETEIVRYWQNRLTLIAMGSLQVRNIISNLPLLAGALDFGGLSTELPVVVTGAGPSLEESLPMLARLRDRFCLLAADTSLPVLLSAGIEPDLVVALEAQLANLQDFIPGRTERALLACDLSSHPGVARLFPGRLCLFASSFAPLRLFDRLGDAGLMPTAFPALGSVGVTTAHAALRLTRGDVFLTGLDFSFPGGRTHARGVPYHLAMMAGSGRLSPVGQASFQSLMARPLLRVTDKKGAAVATDRVLHSYRDSLEDEVKPEAGRVRDCGETGLSLGVRRVEAVEMEERIAGSAPAAAPGQALRIDAARRFRAASLADFVSSERRLLARGLGIAPASAADGIEGLLRDIDYAWVHFPDEPDLRQPDPGFLARVRIAAGYYEQRFGRVASVL